MYSSKKKKHIHLLKFIVFILDCDKLFPPLISILSCFCYFSSGGVFAVWIKLLGSKYLSPGRQRRRGTNGVMVLVVTEGNLQACQSWQRKGAQRFDVSVHYWRSMQFSWPYILDWPSPLQVSLKVISLPSKAGLFFFCLFHTFHSLITIFAWRLFSLPIWVWSRTVKQLLPSIIIYGNKVFAWCYVVLKQAICCSESDVISVRNYLILCSLFMHIYRKQLKNGVKEPK